MLAADVELGYADVDVVSSGKELKNVETNEFIALKDGRTLPIKFRIEEGAVLLVGPGGGTITAAGGNVILVFPPNAVAEQVVITVDPNRSFPTAAGFIVGSVYNFGPDGLEFAVPVQLTIVYDPSHLPTGFDESSLTLLAELGTLWGEADGSTVDVTANTVTGSISGFSGKGVGKKAASVEVSPDGARIQAQETVQLTATVKDASGTELTNRPVNWSSSDAAVATVDQNGLVTAVASGSATITARSGGASDQVTIKVNHPPVASDQDVSGPEDTPLAIVLQGRDADGDPLSFSVASGPGNGTLSGTAPELTYTPAADFVGSDAFTFTVSDGLETGAPATVSISITPVNDAPSVTITSPVDGASFAAGELITFEGSGSDVEDGALTGTALVWTSGLDGQLGTGGLLSRSNLSVGAHHITLTGTDGEGASSSAIITVTITSPVGVVFSAVSAGLRYTCGTTTSGDGYCWGDNTYAQLGDGATTNRSAPVLVSAALAFASVSAGGAHTCGVTTDGHAYCWGVNWQGQLGDGSTTQRSTPVPVSGGFSFQSVSTGQLHTCAVTTSGDAYCWGWNAYGQSGDGTNTNRSTPTLVSGGLTFQSVSAGFNHTCGLTTSGHAYCWGGYQDGQLGVGILPSSPLVPLAVATALTFRSVDAGLLYTCGVSTDGSAYCWGINDFGQLGDGTTTKRTVPVAVSGGLSFESVGVGSVASSQHACAITTGGETYCWGYNLAGQLGDGSTTTRLVPVLVSGGLSFQAVSPADHHTCAVTRGAVGYCWGHNGVGQLGNGTTTNYPTSVPVRVSDPRP